jgi:hypothetical protein
VFAQKCNLCVAVFAQAVCFAKAEREIKMQRPGFAALVLNFRPISRPRARRQKMKLRPESTHATLC